MPDERLEKLRVEIIRATLRVRGAIVARRETITQLHALATDLERVNERVEGAYDA
jgi:hypothetical protein